MQGRLVITVGHIHDLGVDGKPLLRLRALDAKACAPGGLAAVEGEMELGNLFGVAIIELAAVVLAALHRGREQHHGVAARPQQTEPLKQASLARAVRADDQVHAPEIGEFEFFEAAKPGQLGVGDHGDRRRANRSTSTVAALRTRPGEHRVGDWMTGKAQLLDLTCHGPHYGHLRR